MAGTNGNGYTNGHANGHLNGHNGSRITISTGNGAADRLPPYNLEAEQGAIGSMLRDNDVIPGVLSASKAKDYYRDSHEILYETIEGMHKTGLPVDVITLEEELRRLGKLEKVGGLDYILTCIDSVPHAANARYYAQIVKEKARARELIESAHETLREGYSNQYTSEELFERWHKRSQKAESNAEKVDDDDSPIEVASLADIRRHAGEARWLWPGWIIDSQMTVLAAEPATGKTRLTLDLCKRMWNCDPWPDGCEATRPMHTSSLWVASDRNHAEIMRACADFGLPDESLYFNASPADPFGGLKLDDPAEIRLLRRRIKSIRPGLVVIDTINKVTKRLLYRPEEAEAVFAPILDIARDLQVPILALTHLSRSGDPLDRRIEGTCRVLIKMTKPEGDETTTRRRMWVAAIREGKPAPPLGVDMGDEGNDYDGNAPAREEVAPEGGKKVSKTVKATMDWLVNHLKDGPVYCGKLVDDAIRAGHGKTTLWKAIRAAGVITDGEKPNRFYRMPLPGEVAPEGEDDEEGAEE
jgi:replicative DNA helicase